MLHTQLYTGPSRTGLRHIGGELQRGMCKGVQGGAHNFLRKGREAPPAAGPGMGGGGKRTGHRKCPSKSSQIFIPVHIPDCEKGFITSCSLSVLQTEDFCLQCCPSQALNSLKLEQHFFLDK